MKMRSLWLGLGGILAVVALVLGWRYLAAPYTYQGSLIDPPVPAADFELGDQNGRIFRLQDQRGSVIVMAFGYTHCPDVCPTTLAQFKQLKSELGAEAANVRFVFITVDPERDTRERLAAYIDSFDPTFAGLSGSREELEPVWQSYFVYQQRREIGSAAGYLVDHTSRIYVIDKEGNLRLTYPFDIDQQAILSDVNHLLKE